jgi:hypothetical protein
MERFPVKQSTSFVTSDGQWVHEGSDNFFAALGDRSPDYDAGLFAIKNLGFMRFQTFADSVVEVELHPRNVELPALLAVQQQLLTSPVRLFRIKYFDTMWKSEIMVSAESAVARLSELCGPAFAPRCSDRFVSDQQDYRVLFTNSENPLGLMAQKWRMSFGSFDPSVISFAIKHQLLSRMMVVGIKPRHTDPIFRFIGDGFKWLENDYQYYGIGEKIENQPDKEYGTWVAQFYRSVASTGEPRYDIVTAAIQPGPDNPNLFMTRYERLLLPWRTPSEEVFVTLSSARIGETGPIEPEAEDTADEPSSISAKSS